MSTVKVRHLGDDRFSIEVRSHELAVDQPVAAGGTDTAPTPTELFVVSLASCVAHYARRYLARHDLTTDGLEVTAAYEMATGPSRVSAIRVQVSISDEVPHERRAALLAVASHCTVHNSLSQPPSVQVSIDAVPMAVPSG
jgi:putative redox protein